jgi:thioredoxin 1
MPTQVFLDKDGKEFFRHEGFYPKADIEKMLAEKVGINKPPQQ